MLECIDVARCEVRVRSGREIDAALALVEKRISACREERAVIVFVDACGELR
jgi:hypothetical protein